MCRMPPVLYKYLPARFAVRMLLLGEVRIGTLGEYRAADSDDRARADRLENVRPTHVRIDDVTLRLGEPAHPVIDRYFERPRIGGHALRLKNCLILGNPDNRGPGPDRFLYCTSTKLRIELLERFAGCDACVRIEWPEEFHLRIFQSLWDRVECLEGGKVEYGPKDGTCGIWHTHPAWMVKESRYAWQSEFRAIFVPRPGVAVESVIVRNPAIIPLLSVAAMPRRDRHFFGLLRAYELTEPPTE